MGYCKFRYRFVIKFDLDHLKLELSIENIQYFDEQKHNIERIGVNNEACRKNDAHGSWLIKF